MLDKQCTGCRYHKRVHIAAHGEERDRCFRPKMMTDGTFQECGMKGFDAETERGDTPGPGRLPGDICGPSARHWRAG